MFMHMQNRKSLWALGFIVPLAQVAMFESSALADDGGPVAALPDAGAAAVAENAPAAAGDAATDSASPPPTTSATGTPPAAATPPPQDPPSGWGAVGQAVADAVEAANVNLKVYGDVQGNVFSAVPQQEPTRVAFSARRFELLPSAEFGRFSFIAEFLAEVPSALVAPTNGFGPGPYASGANGGQAYGFDVERLELAYLVNNYLRIRVGRVHNPLGYYNDSYHHGNIFELTTGRPFLVNFEDTNGLLMSHLVGATADGTFNTEKLGSLRYDVGVGNSHAQDFTAVPVGLSESNTLTEILRLRWTPIDDLSFGVNGMHSSIPACAPGSGVALCPPSGAGGRPETTEYVAGVHLVYMGNNFHSITEGYVIDHIPDGQPHQLTYGGFSELGYTIGMFTPYVRGEYIRFPNGGDIVYQQPDSLYANTLNFSDLRAGVKFQPFPQVAFKLEAERYYTGGTDHEMGTLKIAFGF